MAVLCWARFVIYESAVSLVIVNDGRIHTFDFMIPRHPRDEWFNLADGALARAARFVNK